VCALNQAPGLSRELSLFSHPQGPLTRAPTCRWVEPSGQIERTEEREDLEVKERNGGPNGGLERLVCMQAAVAFSIFADPSPPCAAVCFLVAGGGLPSGGRGGSSSSLSCSVPPASACAAPSGQPGSLTGG